MNPDLQHRDGPSGRAFTLVESIMAVLIVSVVVVSVLYTFGSEARGRQVQTSASVADGLAAQLMGEVLQGKYADPNGPNTFGPEAAEINGTRSGFDDVDDYNGWTETPPQNKAGTAIAGLTGWRRSVTVEYVDPATMVAGGSTDTGLKRITVTLTDPGGRTTSVSALRSSAGTYEQSPPASSTTYVAWVGLTLQVGADAGGKIVSGTATPGLVP